MYPEDGIDFPLSQVQFELRVSAFAPILTKYINNIERILLF